jgi:hypothetical protein
MTMRALWITLLATSMFAGPALAQAPVASQETKDAMAKLSFLLGKWTGDASVEMGPARHEVSQVETVESRLDGLVLVIEGKGTTKDGVVQHHALATISYDDEAKNYRVVAYRKDGKCVVTTGRFLPDGAFEWGFDMGNMAVRYVIRQGESGEWLETGEMSFDKATWKKFIDMRLKRAS